MAYLILPVFFLGLCVGSFLNVLIYRLPRGLNFIKGRSFCPKCRKKISWFDNIPLLSFLILRGKCRHCRSTISIRYPIVEFLTSGLFVLTISQIGQIGLIRLILSLILISALIVIFFIDLEHQIIPDAILLPVIIIFLIYKIHNSVFIIHSSWFTPLIPALGSFLFLFLIWAVTRGRGMGFGDVKFAFLMGLSLGFPRIVIAFYIAFLTGASLGVILILVKKVRLGQQIAFGPFLALGMFITLIWGEDILGLVQKILF